jgi:hypothetical protein
MTNNTIVALAQIGMAALMASSCSGSTVNMGEVGKTCAIPEGCPDGGSIADGAPGSDGADAAAPDAASGFGVTVRLRASTAKVQHLDGLSGQTPVEQRIGIRKLTLLTSDADPSPFVVFDHKAEAIEAGLGDNDDTLVATLSASALRAGNYTRARVAISHVRYRVAASMHAFGMIVPGVFDNFQVLSDGSTIDGKTWNKGHYSFKFDVNGQTYGTQTGENGPVPPTTGGGGMSLESSGNETEYRFPVTLAIPQNVPSNVTIRFELNTHENFRWQDQADPGYQKGTFDATLESYEPVTSFGANSFQMSTTIGQ